MRLKRFTLLLFLCCCMGKAVVFGQGGLPYYQINENKTWIFGTKGGLNFNTTPPTAIASNNVEGYVGPKLGSGTSAVSDNAGQLRFYAQLDTIWDKNGNVMPNGGGLITGLPTIGPSGAAYYDGASLIVPKPGSPDKYYVFSQTSIATTNAISSIASTYGGNDPRAGRLYYSLVDMTLNGGLGAVVASQKGIRIDSLLCDRLVAVTGPSCNIWVLCMKNDGSAIHAFEVSPAGVNPNPVISPCAVTIAGGVSISPLFQMPGGCMRTSSDGTKLAVSLAGVVLNLSTFSFIGGNFQLYDFNNVTGTVSNQINVLPPSSLLTLDQQIFNLSFSPDNTKIYTPHGLLIGTGLSQFDISSGVAATIVASKFELGSATGIGSLTGIRLGPDDRIYVGGTSLFGLFGSNNVHRINTPNVGGAGSGFTLNAMALAPGAQSALGLCNATVQAPPADTTFASHSLTLCAPQPSVDLSVPTDPEYTYLWDDGSVNNTRTVTGSGTYWVVYGPTCPKLVDTFHVEAIDVQFSLGNDTVICGDIFPFDLKGPVVAGATYLWQDGSTGPTFNVSGAGVYSLTIAKEDCTASDEIRIDNFNVFQDLGPDTMVCARTPFTIRLDARVPEGASVLWSTGATSPGIDVSQPGTYGVSVTQNICVGTDSITIRNTELCDCIAFMPNAFTPNGDGLNDVFTPIVEPACTVRGYNFQVFNRWGERVFSTVTSEKGWDGTFNGKPADPGTYWFTISFEKGTRSHLFTQKGDFALVR